MINMQTNKFEFKDLKFGDDQFVSAPTFDQGQEQEQELINEAVTEQLSDNMINVPLDQIINEGISTIPKEPSYSESEIAAIREEAYAKGKMETEALLQPQIQAVEADKSFNDLVKAKIEALSPQVNIQSEIDQALVHLVEVIAKKLHLHLNSDFESIINQEILPILNKYYKNGSIIFRIHPDRVDYCKKLFKIGELSQDLFENVEFVGDDNVSQNDCRIDMNEASINYNHEDLINEVEKILDHLKIENKN